MIKLCIISLSILLAGEPLVKADQFDYVLGFADATTAMADAIAATNLDGGGTNWMPDHAMRVTVSRISTGLPITGYFVLISFNRVIPALRDHAALKVAIDRELCVARKAGCILRQTVGTVVLQDMIINPVYMGSDFPWGGFQ